MLEKVKGILQENSLCVLCTAGGSHPHCSLMTYVLGDDLRMLYMVSVQKSRKYRNMLENSNVSVVVDNRQRLSFPSEDRIISVTFEGIYQHLEQEERESACAHLVDAHVELNEILKSPDCVIFGIRLKSFLLLNGPVDSLQGDL